jgi:DCN1-like protein 4/5
LQKASIATSSKSRQAFESYDSTRALTLFKKYADADDPNVIGPEGFTQLCTDAQMPMEGALPLVLAWQLQAKEMGKLTKNEWLQAMSQLQ